jgi:cytochrome c-type biogenesis protein CcmH
MTRRLLTLWLLAALPATAEIPADVARTVGPPRGPALTGEALERRTQEVGGLLRCPVCQGLSVADSPADLAQNMRAQVKEMLGAGYDQDQILRYFERSYGEFVRLEPALRGVNWAVWLAPLLGLLAGAAVVAWALARSAKAAPRPPAPQVDGPGPDALPDEPELHPYVLKVRELAYGWPGGIAPREPNGPQP